MTSSRRRLLGLALALLVAGMLRAPAVRCEDPPGYLLQSPGAAEPADLDAWRTGDRHEGLAPYPPHPPGTPNPKEPLFTDNAMHDLRVERFYAGRPEGVVKTFPLRGVKDSPPYLHDGRALTLEDAVLFFDLVLGARLTAAERDDLVAYLRAL